TGEEALKDAFTTVARNASKGRGAANTLGAGSRIAGGILGPIGVALSGYSLYSHIHTGAYGDIPADLGGIVSGGLATYAAVTASVAAGTIGAGIGLGAVSYLLAGWAGGKVGHAVTEATGSKAAGVTVGTITGAGIGAAAGAAIGVWFFGIGA